MSIEIPHAQRSFDSSQSSTTVLPSLPSLRIGAEDHLLYAIISAMSSPTTVQRPPTDLAMGQLVVPYFIHLASLGDHDDLGLSANREMLVRLGRGLLQIAGNKSSHEAQPVKNRQRSATSRSHRASERNNARFNQSENYELPLTRLSLCDELNLSHFAAEGASHPEEEKAMWLGLLSLKINRFGFSPREEEALRALGGSPEVFRHVLQHEAIPLPEDLRGYPAPIVGSIMPDYTMTEISNRHIVLEGEESKLIIEARWPNFSGCFWHDKSPPTVEITRNFLKVRSGDFINRNTDLNLSGRFDGLTAAQVEILLRKIPEDTRKKVVAQVQARHRAVLAGPPAMGERRLLNGTPVWASNICEHLPELVNLNHRDLSNLSLGNAVLSRKQMAGCRFEGSDLSEALCHGTNFRDSRFGSADLSDAFIAGSDLRGAELSEANLSRVRWDYILDIECAEAPLIDRKTRFLPLNWDQTYNPSDSEIETQVRRFEGWTAHQFEIVRNNVGPLQRIALKRLENLLRKHAKNNLILPPCDRTASAHEFLPEIVVGGISEKEMHEALSRNRVYVNSAGLPLLTGNHQNKDLTTYDLHGGFIDRASLVNATMAGQNLHGAVISNSDLSGINLRGANLTDALLVNVDLAGADLRSINLTRTRFVNCNLNGVQLERVTMIDTQMQQCTLANITIREGVIEDLLVCKSDIQQIAFSGNPDGNGLVIRGIGLLDSIMINAQFSGFTTVNQIELLGSLFVGSGPGILDDAEIILSPESEWRDRMIQVIPDTVLGDISYELSAARVRQTPSRREGGSRDHLKHRPSAMNVILEESISWGGQQHGAVSRFDHLRDIGFQPDEISRKEPTGTTPKLILPARVQ